MAHLAERSLTTPEVRGSTPVIIKFLKNIFVEETKITKNVMGLARLKKKLSRGKFE